MWKEQVGGEEKSKDIRMYIYIYNVYRVLDPDTRSPRCDIRRWCCGGRKRNLVRSVGTINERRTQCP